MCSFLHTSVTLFRPVVGAHRVGAGRVVRVPGRAVRPAVEQQHARHSAGLLEAHQGGVAGGGQFNEIKTATKVIQDDTAPCVLYSVDIKLKVAS